MRIVKFNLDYKVKSLELAQKGYNFNEIANMLGVAVNTLSLHRQRDSKFNEQLLKARKDSIRDLVELKTVELASGVETTETTDAYIIEGTEGQIIKRTVKTIKHKPESKALSMLSNKHKLGYSDKEVSEEDTKPLLNINFSGLSYREVQDVLRSSPIELTEDEVFSND